MNDFGKNKPIYKFVFGGMILIMVYIILTAVIVNAKSPRLIVCKDESITKMNTRQLNALIKSNTDNIMRLEELMGTSVDNSLTNLKGQIKIFLRQIECAKEALNTLADQ